MAKKKRTYEQYKEYDRKKREEASRKRIEAVRAEHPSPEWMPIPGFTTYLISRHGEIIGKYGKSIKPGINKLNKYRHVMLTGDDGKSKHMYVHQAVWNTFKGTRTNGKRVCHLDANPENNSLDNLAEMTLSENLKKSVTQEKIAKARMKASYKPGGKLKTYKYDKDGNLVRVYDSVKSTIIDGHSVNSVSLCCSGRQKTHQGYKFSHVKLRKLRRRQ